MKGRVCSVYLEQAIKWDVDGAQGPVGTRAAQASGWNVGIRYLRPPHQGSSCQLVCPPPACEVPAHPQRWLASDRAILTAVHLIGPFALVDQINIRLAPRPVAAEDSPYGTLGPHCLTCWAQLGAEGRGQGWSRYLCPNFFCCVLSLILSTSTTCNQPPSSLEGIGWNSLFTSSFYH